MNLTCGLRCETDRDIFAVEIRNRPQSSCIQTDFLQKVKGLSLFVSFNDEAVCCLQVGPYARGTYLYFEIGV